MCRLISNFYILKFFRNSPGFAERKALIGKKNPTESKRFIAKLGNELEFLRCPSRLFWEREKKKSTHSAGK